MSTICRRGVAAAANLEAAVFRRDDPRLERLGGRRAALGDLGRPPALQLEPVTVREIDRVRVAVEDTRRADPSRLDGAVHPTSPCRDRCRSTRQHSCPSVRASQRSARRDAPDGEA